MPEICSENERGLERQNLLPFFRYKTSWDTCQVEIFLDLLHQLLLYAARDASSLLERERKPSFARERERDPESGAPLPGHVNKEVEKTWPGNENEDHAA